MRQSQPSTIAANAAIQQTDTSEFLRHCYRSAIRRLGDAYAASRPVAIVIGEGEAATEFVVSRFLDGLDENCVAVRISEPCSDAGELMRQIVTGVGFEPKDMDVDDLQSVFRMFLSFQKSHECRTVICMEQIQNCEWWVLDKIRKLVELEAGGKFGLMLVISGQPGLRELLHTRPLSAVSMHAGQRITLKPFTLKETTEYIRQRAGGENSSSLEQAFHFHAIPLIHELCAGVPDAVATLVAECFEFANRMGLDLITTDIVKQAYEIQRSGTSPEPADAPTVNLNGSAPRAGRLVVQISGEEVREMAVRYGHILIGRSNLCDIRLVSRMVSRHHALISYTSDGAILVDLGSTNGTFVDGYRIDQHCMTAGETITVGDCKLEYIVDDEMQTPVSTLLGLSDDMLVTADTTKQ